MPELSFSLTVCDVNIRDAAQEERAGIVSAVVRELTFLVLA
jgi:hypothetical protein